MITHLFCDFDNTLLETESHALPSLIERFNTLYNQSLTLDMFKQHFHGQARENLCRSLGAFFKVDVDYALLYRAREHEVLRHYQRHAQAGNGVPMAANVIEALTEIKAKGVRLAVVTNNPIQRALGALRFADNKRGAELAALFETDFYAAGEIQKPAPDVYLFAMEQTGGLAAHSAAIEDSVVGVTAAVAAGLTAYGFTGFADDKASAEANLRDAGARAVFSNWRDLPTLWPALLAEKS